ncbi:hypothetical protein D082_26810 [Synechocystis sp. PCC 6714]|nr:hypothetical protein D082_26810 [Synechocystis sp. PCC 6714]
MVRANDQAIVDSYEWHQITLDKWDSTSPETSNILTRNPQIAGFSK